MKKMTGGKRDIFGISTVSILVFLVLLGLLSFILFNMISNRLRMENLQMEQLIVEKSLKINEVVSRHLNKTQVIAAMVVQGDGHIEDFGKMAAALVDDPAILNVLIAPDGIVTHAFSLDTNESALIGFDYFADEAGNMEALLAIETGELVMAGPFIGRQEQLILAGRLPVYLNSPSGEREFWGLVSVTLRFPQALGNVGLDVFEAHGYAYELWRITPETNEKQVIVSSERYMNSGKSTIIQPVNVLNANWFISLSHIDPWYVRHSEIIVMIIAGLLSIFLIAFIMQNNHKLKIAKLKLAEAVMQAETASRAKSMFLASMSHEIRTPLNGVIGFAEITLDDKSISEETREQVTKSLNSANSLLNVVNNVLDVTKIESGKMELEMIAFDLPLLLDTCKFVMKPAAGDKNIPLIVNITDDLKDQLKDRNVVGDPTKMRQIFYNLLSNAVKFTEQGAVRLSAGLAGHEEDTVSVCFAVTDSGIGMNEAQLNRIFEPFIQADLDTSREYGGTGLGLFIVKDFVEKMGGDLQVESVRGIGSKFTFTLKFNTVPGQSGHLSGSSLTDAEELMFSGDVLVCEDNSINWEVIGRQLSMVGLSPELAVNGAIGLEMVTERQKNNKPYDLIFMDIHMPVMNGFTASKEIIALGVETPILAVTADVTTDNILACKNAGIKDYLSKPIRRTALQNCLLKYLMPEMQLSIDNIDDTLSADAVSGDTGAGDSVLGDTEAPVDYELGLENAAGDKNLYNSIIEDFINVEQDTYDRLKKAIEDKDFTLAFELAHKEKGVALIIGANRLPETLSALQHSIENGSEENPEDLLELYKRELDTVLKYLKKV